jgi:glycine hydroxymethyltransferase
MAAYMAALQPGDKILGMNLAHGGHLTHGSPLNFSGMFYQVVPYGVKRDTELLDYDGLEELALREKPKMIVAGASAYSRILHFDRLGAICRKVGCYLMVDIAHIAGLIVAGLHPNPVPYADFVTSTTHKTLRGPRGGLILCKEQHKKALDKLVFPGIQGGPLVHTIAAKAVCFKEAQNPDFKEYQAQVVRNAARLCQAVGREGFRIVSGGTDTHLCLVDVFSKGITGKVAQASLERASITVNKNAIPFDTNPPAVASGIRIGSPAVTTRGMKEPEMDQIGKWIGTVLEKPEDESVQAEVRKKVHALTSCFPLYAKRLAAFESSVV